MSNIKDIIIGLGVNTFVFIVWAYKMLATSDIPVKTSLNDGILISCLLVLLLILYNLYARKTQYVLMNIVLLLIPLLVWFMSLQQAVIYNYHKYDTYVSIIGFSTTLISFIQLIYLKVKIKFKM